jgi:lipopolysaccharide biosynthesis regulator YciM
METNRQETAEASIINSIDTVLATLEAELKATRKAINDLIDSDPDLKNRSDLLNTIPSIGAATTAHLLVALDQHHDFSNAKQVVAFAGLARTCTARIRAMAWQYPHCQKWRFSLA